MDINLLTIIYSKKLARFNTLFLEKYHDDQNFLIMEFVKKLNRAFLPLLLLFSTPLVAQDKEPKTFLFGLIKLDRESEFEDGYWINKCFYTREFAAPVNIITIEWNVKE